MDNIETTLELSLVDVQLAFVNWHRNLDSGEPTPSAFTLRGDGLTELSLAPNHPST